MAFKRSAVRSRLSPPNCTGPNLFRFGPVFMSEYKPKRRIKAQPGFIDLCFFRSKGRILLCFYRETFHNVDTYKEETDIQLRISTPQFPSLTTVLFSSVLLESQQLLQPQKEAKLQSSLFGAVIFSRFFTSNQALFA